MAIIRNHSVWHIEPECIHTTFVHVTYEERQERQRQSDFGHSKLMVNNGIMMAMKHGLMIQ